MADIEDRPLVSIITPCLNRAAYIRDVVSSIGDQTYEPIEHIIVDGGSSDDTLDVLKELEHTCNLRWISEPDAGMYHAINKGLALSRGMILGYLNTDDLYFPWTVEAAVSALQSDPACGFTYGDMVVLDEMSGGAALALYPPFGMGLLQRSAFLGQPTVFFRRSAYLSFGGFDETLRYVADCDYWLRIGASMPGRKVSEILAVQRNHPGTLRSSRRSDLEKEIRLVRSRYERRAPFTTRLLSIADRLYLFANRRYQLLMFLKAVFRHRADPDYRGPWWRFLHQDDMFSVSIRHVVGGILPLAGKAMLFRMARPRSGVYRTG